jgi:hypothetical protein
MTVRSECEVPSKVTWSKNAFIVGLFPIQPNESLSEAMHFAPLLLTSSAMLHGVLSEYVAVFYPSLRALGYSIQKAELSCNATCSVLVYSDS